MFTSELFLFLANQFIDAHEDAIYSAVFLSFRFSFDRYSLSHAFPSDLMMANKQGKIQMYFYELLWLIQRLDNKKNIRLDRWPRSGRPFPAVEDERRRVDTLSECLSSPL
jgi:hypothetical protein